MLGFASSVLLLARTLPRRRASQVADGLHDGALDGVELTRGLADKRGIILRRVKQYNAKCKTYLGSPDVVLFIDDDIV